jgi:hypothetical protein
MLVVLFAQLRPGAGVRRGVSVQPSEITKLLVVFPLPIERHPTASARAAAPAVGVATGSPPA